MVQECITTDASESTAISGSTTGVGQQVNTGFIPDFTVTRIRWNLKKELTPTTLTIQCQHLNSSGVLQDTSSDTYSTTTLTDSFAEYDFEFSSLTISDGDIFVIVLSGSISSGGVVIKAGSNAVANTTMMVQQSGSWSTRSRDCDMCFIGVADPTGTFFPPPVAYI